MPYINLKLAGKLTREQKEEIVKQFADTLYKVAAKPPEHTYIVIDEVSSENWGVCGNLLSDKQFSQKKGSVTKTKS